MKFNASKRLKELFKSMLLEFSTAVSDKGVLKYDSEDMEPGVSVVLIDEEGNESTPEDGNYTLEDETVLVIKDGKIDEIVTPAEPEPEVVEETVEETVENLEETPIEEEHPEEKVEEVIEEPETPVEDTPEEKKDEILDAIQALKETIDALEERIKALENTPAAKPINEEFEAVKKQKSTGNKNLDFACRVAAARK